MKKPLNGLVLVSEITDPETTKSGILIAEAKHKHKLQKATVIQVGEGLPLSVTLNLTMTGTEKEALQELISLVKDGVPPKVSVGDVVIYKSGQGTNVRVDDKDLVLINEVNLMGVL